MRTCTWGCNCAVKVRALNKASNLLWSLQLNQVRPVFGHTLDPCVCPQYKWSDDNWHNYMVYNLDIAVLGRYTACFKSRRSTKYCRLKKQCRGERHLRVHHALSWLVSVWLQVDTQSLWSRSHMADSCIEKERQIHWRCSKTVLSSAVITTHKTTFLFTPLHLYITYLGPYI